MDDNPTEPNTIRPDSPIHPHPRLSGPSLKSDPFHDTPKSEQGRVRDQEGLFEDVRPRVPSHRRDSTSSNILPETVQNSASQLLPPGIFQTPPPRHPTSDQHLLRDPSPSSLPLSSPNKRRREETIDSGLGSSMRHDSVDHTRGEYTASYPSSLSGGIAQNVFDGPSQISAGFMERMNATSEILRTNWEELNSVKGSLNAAMKELQLEKGQVTTLQKQISSLTDVLSSVQAEKTVAVSTIAELQADNELLQRTNKDLVDENKALKESLEVSNHHSDLFGPKERKHLLTRHLCQEAVLPKPKRARFVRGPDYVPKPRIVCVPLPDSLPTY